MFKMLNLYRHTFSIPFKYIGIHPKKFMLRNFQNVSLYVSSNSFYGAIFDSYRGNLSALDGKSYSSCREPASKSCAKVCRRMYGVRICGR